MLDTCAMGAQSRITTVGKANWVDPRRNFAMARGSQRKAATLPRWTDEVVRYELPLHRPPMLERGQRFRMASRSRRTVPRSEGGRHRHDDRADGALTFLGLQDQRGRVRSPVIARCLAAGLRGCARLARGGGGNVGPARRAEPRARSHRRERAAYVRPTSFSPARGKAAAPRRHVLRGARQQSFDRVAMTVHGLHVDLVRAPNRSIRCRRVEEGTVLSAGVVDGRNIWRRSREAARLVSARGEVGSDRSGSRHLLVTSHRQSIGPGDVARPRAEDLARVRQAEAPGGGRARQGRSDRGGEEQNKLRASRKSSKRINKADVQRRAAAVTEKDRVRKSPFAKRRSAQVDLPPYPTTTIGSFPQTNDVRAARRKLNDGQLTAEAYDRFIEEQITKTVALQEEIGLDVLVHGDSSATTWRIFRRAAGGLRLHGHGWVQSYGTRYGDAADHLRDVARPRAMTCAGAVRAVAITEQREGACSPGR